MSNSSNTPSESGAPTVPGSKRLKFKIVLIGAAAVGKTAIAQGLVAGTVADLPAQYQPTAGVEFYKQELHLAAGVQATLQLWDTGGQVSSLHMVANYLSGCDAILIVHDMRQETYAAACEWLGVVREMFAETGLPLVALVANKSETAELQEQAAQLQTPVWDDGIACCSHYCVSAKTGHGLQHMLRSVACALAGVPLTASAGEEHESASTAGEPEQLCSLTPQVPVRHAQKVRRWIRRLKAALLCGCDGGGCVGCLRMPCVR